MKKIFSISEMNSMTYCCPTCDAEILHISRSGFDVKQGESWTEGGDALQPLYKRIDLKAARNFDAGLMQGRCMSCGDVYYSVDVIVTAEEKSDDWWTKCQGGEKTYLDLNYLVESNELTLFLGHEWFFYSEIFKGTRVEYHTFPLTSDDIDDDCATDELLGHMPLLIEISRKLAKEPSKSTFEVKEEIFVFDDPESLSL